MALTILLLIFTIKTFFYANIVWRNSQVAVPGRITATGPGAMRVGPIVSSTINRSKINVDFLYKYSFLQVSIKGEVAEWSKALLC